MNHPANKTQEEREYCAEMAAAIRSKRKQHGQRVRLEDLKHLETRKFTEAEILRIFQVPRKILTHDARWWSGKETMKESETNERKSGAAVVLQRMVRQIGQFDGWGASKRIIYEFIAPSNVVSSHSCLLPKFSITMRVGELRKLIANLDDDDGLTATVADEQATQFTFVR